MARGTTRKITQIVAFQRGAFAMVGVPPDWVADTAKIYDPKTAMRLTGVAPTHVVGDVGRQNVQVFPLASGNGYRVELWHPQAAYVFWCETDADLLEFLTTRAPSWQGLEPFQMLEVRAAEGSEA